MTLCGIITTMLFFVIVLFVGLHFKSAFQHELDEKREICQINVRGITGLKQKETDEIFHMSGVAGIKVDMVTDISVAPDGVEEERIIDVGLYDDRYPFINSKDKTEQMPNDIFVTSDFLERNKQFEMLRIYIKTTDHEMKYIDISDFTVLPAEAEQSFSIMQNYDVFVPVSLIQKFSVQPIGYNLVIYADSYNNVRNIVDFLISNKYKAESKITQIEAIVSQIELCNIILGFVGIVIFVVAFLMIFNYVILYLEDRYTYLGMLKAVGITNFSIFFMCFLRIEMLCLIGAASGGILGLGVLQIVSCIGIFKFTIVEGLTVCLYGTLFVLATGFLAVFWPVSKTARIDVIELLEERT